MQRARRVGGGRSPLLAIDESSAASPDLAARASLARLIEEARPEILEQWIELLEWQGLPHQRQAAEQRSANLYVEYGHILDVILAWLHASDPDAEARARQEIRSLYREYGWRWATRDHAGPDLAVDPPRITQAVWRVLLRHCAADLTPPEVLHCAVTLNVLAMDLAMARVSGYLSSKETQLATQQETLSRLMDELTRVEMRQRQALALELHDNLAQRLASLFNGIQRCGHVIERDVQAAKGELEHLRQVASEALRDARTMIRDLHFGVSSQEGGLSALVEYLADLDEDTGIHHVARIPAALPSLPPMQESLILRVIQEALRNAHKHAQATEIVVTAETSAEALTVEIRDDGPGFDVDEALTRSQRRGRLGLIGMRERADLLGASLSIDSAPGAGTAIRLRVPLTEKGPSQA